MIGVGLMTARLHGKIAVVTGGSSGIGLETARLFVAEGAIVAALDVTPFPTESLSALGSNASRLDAYMLDISSEDDVERTFTLINERYSKVDILVNSAGVMGPDSLTHELDISAAKKLFDVDLFGVMIVTKYALKSMIEAGSGGSIVNVSSTYGLVASDEFSAYHVAKAAVAMQTKQDAVNYGKFGIRVNSVHPSTTLTPLVEQIGREFPGGLDAYQRKMTSDQPIARFGTPLEIAQAILFLASDGASLVTGVNLPVDGGYTAK